ncbi:MAG TPA: UbiD family decarboxylase [Candidatus Acidoferrales bacterium]|nr:UbiD family decarboxylase [Candidatus Acidoferrales bacterium]
MPFQSLRDFIEAVEERGDLLRIDGADREGEIGALAEIVASTPKHPMVLFDRIRGFPPGYRVSSNAMSGVKRMALGLGLDPEFGKVELVRAWKEKLKTFKPVAPRKIESGPVAESFLSGKDVDLEKFPAPKWHELDGGYYIGTGCCVLTRDPDENWINMGVYRVVVHDESTLGIFINHLQHGRLILEKYWARGKSCPVVISFGQEPALFLAAAQREPWGVGELSAAGWLRGEPVEVMEGEITGLPVPAHAEIVVEGEIPPLTEESRPEGPFGERTGYYATGTRNEPVVRVLSLMHRKDPIIQGEPPLKPVPGMDHFGIPLPAAAVWSALEHAGIQDVRGVWLHGPFATVISLRQRYDGHARQAAAIALGVRATVHLGRFVIVVDDDIDPSDLRDVFWAVTTRCDPATQTEVVNHFPTSDINPRVAPEDRKKGRFTSSKIIVDACRPYGWIQDFPRTNTISAEKRASIQKKWQHVLAKLE